MKTLMYILMVGILVSPVFCMQVPSDTVVSGEAYIVYGTGEYQKLVPFLPLFIAVLIVSELLLNGNDSSIIDRGTLFWGCLDEL